MRPNPTQELLDRRVAQVAFDHEERRLNDLGRIPPLRARAIARAVEALNLRKAA